VKSSAWHDVAAILDDAVGAGHVAPAAALLVGRGSLVLVGH
jgi:hypothetical protein